MLLPVVEGSSSQNDGVVVGPFRGVTPDVLQRVPEVAPRRVSHNPLGEAPPHQEGKVHLRGQKSKHDDFLLKSIFRRMTSTRGRCSFAAHGPHWSAGRCPRPGSAPLPSLWQREVGTDCWSVRGGGEETKNSPS